MAIGAVVRRWNIMDLRMEKPDVYDLLILRDEKDGHFIVARIDESADRLHDGPQKMKVIMDSVLIGNERVSIETSIYINKLEKAGCAVKKIL